MRVLILVAVDALTAVVAVFVAYRLRFDPAVLPDFLSGAGRVAVLTAVLVPTWFAIGRVYARPMGRLWPIRILVGSTVAFALAAAVLWATGRFEGVSRFAFPAAALLTTLGAAGWRSVVRIRELMRPAAVRSTQQFDDLAEPDRSIGLNLMKLWAYRELVRNLVLKDLKLKYRGSALGFIWSLVNPLMMLAVYSFAFTYILGIRREGFVYFLLLGILPWTFFASTAGMSTGSIADAGGLLRSVRFPRTVLPVATVIFNLAQYLLTFAVLLPIMLLVFGIAPSGSMLAFPVVLVLLVLFTTGVAFILAAASAFFRDVKHLVEIGLGALFWMTPILYDLASVPERFRLPILLMPVSPFVTMSHDIFYHRVWPDGSIWAAATCWSAATFMGGVSMFLSYEDRFAEHV
jgi:homopolymeric O-antigen transport system permease protein